MVTIDDLRRTMVTAYCPNCCNTFVKTLDSFLTTLPNCIHLCTVCTSDIQVIQMDNMSDTIYCLFGNKDLNSIQILMRLPKRYDCFPQSIYKVMCHVRHPTLSPRDINLNNKLKQIFQDIEQW